MPIEGPHGFVWPDGLPDCKVCGRDANDPNHVNPAKANIGLPVRSMAADKATPTLPVQSHAYTAASTTLLKSATCQACRQTMANGNHPIGMHSGYVGGGRPTPVPQVAFVSQVRDRVVLAAPASTDTGLLQIASHFGQRSNVRSANQWIAGRYVEADTPNRNAAYWSTADLELGQPSIANGPINWLHEGQHVIGTLVASEMVRPDLQAAAAGEANHIVALGATWPWLYPNEARVIEAASEAGKLWFSMECISRAVACLADGCGHQVSYRDYITEKAGRCDHMGDGQPRRFVDPMFLGAGIIVPPVRPGWGRADARVLLPQAAAAVEKQAAAFTGLTSTEAESIVIAINNS